MIVQADLSLCWMGMPEDIFRIGSRMLSVCGWGGKVRFDQISVLRN